MSTATRQPQGVSAGAPEPPWVGDDPPPPDDGRGGRSAHGAAPWAPALRVPPHSLEAEHAVLGALLIDPAAYPLVCDTLAPADFYAHANRLVYGAIGALAAEGAEADPVSVFERLGPKAAAEAGGLPYLVDLQTCVVGSANVQRHAAIVAERAALRAIVAAADELAAGAFATGADPGAVIDAAKTAIGTLELRRKLPRRGVPLLSLDALREQAQAVRWLVKRVLPADSIGMLFGGSGTFKSFIALDAALHVAHGLPWLGRQTQPGPVLYIAAEGGAGLWSRINAWHIARNLRWQGVPLHVVPVAVDLHADAWRVVEAAQLAGVAPVMVIVDTLSQTYAGEENSANEMAAYLRELGLRFRALWQCTVLLVHHSGHQATERPRGSSAIRANLDFLLGVSRDAEEMLATVGCIKQKDGELFDDAVFTLTQVRVGTDADGDPVTSLVARRLSSAEELDAALASERAAGRLGKNQQLLQLLQNGMREKDLRRAFIADCCAELESEAASRTYRRAKGWAMKAGYFEVAQGTVITLKPTN